MGGAIKGLVSRTGKAANALVGNKEPEAAPTTTTIVKDPTAEQLAKLQEVSNQQETAGQLATRRKRGRASTLLASSDSTGSTAAKSLLGA